MIWKDLGIVVGLPVIRSISGWAVKALEDKKVTNFELKQLVSTIVRVGSIGLVAYFGINAAGFDVSALATAAGAYLADIVLSAVKAKK